MHAESATISGDFNNWSTTSHRLRHYRDGHFANTVELDTGREYRSRYLLDSERWENDRAAEAYVPNDCGSEDSLIRV